MHMLLIRQLGLYLTDLLFPPHCAGCQSPGYVLCSTCLSQLQPQRLPRCNHCHSQLTPQGLCKPCHYRPLAISGLRTVGFHRGPLRTCIHALKYQGNKRLAEPLGQLLAQAYKDYGLRADWIVPVPLHRGRQQERRYNQATLLARVCADQLGLPLREDLVIRRRATAVQMNLGVQDRWQNVKDAFAYSAKVSVRGCNILLIDDVCTTGATIEACALPLLEAKARSVWGLVLARPL